MRRRRQLGSLWRVKFTESTPVPSPAALLRAQAEYLGERTGGVVTATVTSRTVRSSAQMVHTFRLVVPDLDDYSYSLLQLVSGPAPYPITIRWGDEELAAPDQDALVDGLRMVFNSPRTTEIITNLMQMAEDTETPDA